MLLGIIVLSAVSLFVICDYLNPTKPKTSEEKLGETLTGYLKSIRTKGE